MWIKDVDDRRERPPEANQESPDRGVGRRFSEVGACRNPCSVVTWFAAMYLVVADQPRPGQEQLDTAPLTAVAGGAIWFQDIMPPLPAEALKAFMQTSIEDNPAANPGARDKPLSMLKENIGPRRA